MGTDRAAIAAQYPVLALAERAKGDVRALFAMWYAAALTLGDAQHSDDLRRVMALQNCAAVVAHDAAHAGAIRAAVAEQRMLGRRIESMPSGHEAVVYLGPRDAMAAVAAVVDPKAAEAVAEYRGTSLDSILCLVVAPGQSTTLAIRFEDRGPRPDVGLN